MTDYIIVGAGLAGIAFAETALRNGKSICVFDNESQNSSRIAGGLYNPVILKRFTQLADAQEQLDAMERFYEVLEHKTGELFNFPMPVFRKFFSIEEQNNWFAASDKPGLSAFLSTDLISKKFRGIDSPFGFGEVLQTGFVDTALLLEQYKKYLIGINSYRNDTFDYNAVQVSDDCIAYNGTSAKHVVFAEGFGLHSNPFFNYLPLDGTKGELLIISAPNLDLDVVINTSVFIIPLGNGLFKVGATYNWFDKTAAVTEQGKTELVEKIKEILQCDFEIVEHLAGVRPTIKDRKALLGTHPQYNQLHILNGLGTRGVMLGPAMAQLLYNHIEHKEPIARDINITRFSR